MGVEAMVDGDGEGASGPSFDEGTKVGSRVIRGGRLEGGPVLRVVVTRMNNSVIKKQEDKIPLKQPPAKKGIIRLRMFVEGLESSWLRS